MKHVKVYELFDYKWKNIEEKDGKVYLNLYDLSHEMEAFANKNRDAIVKMESEYKDLIRKLLIGNVITFSSDEYDEITDICDDVEFHSGFGTPDEYDFQFQHIQIKTEDLEEATNIDDDKVIIHLDSYGEIFKKSKKFNL
jgi:hypothetical protein